MDHDFVGAIAAVLIFGGPVAAFVLMRGMQHRERMEMIRHGMVPTGRGRRDWRPEAPPPPQQQAPPPDARGYYGSGWDEPPQRMLRKAMGLTAIGFALTLGLGFIGFLVDPGRFVPGPWLLGGLIPLFIGLAQVFTAIMAGARLGPPPVPGGAYSPQFGPRQASQSVPPPPPTFDGPYAYRPDASQQELARPPAPPDRR